MDRAGALQAVIRALEQKHAAMLVSARATQQGATHEEARPENNKDTRALEASYLARGQAARVESLGEAITRLQVVAADAASHPRGEVALGSLVQLTHEASGERAWIFVLPEGGGTVVDHDGTPLRVVTPTAPLAQALLGKALGDESALRLGGRAGEFAVTALL